MNGMNEWNEKDYPCRCTCVGRSVGRSVMVVARHHHHGAPSRDRVPTEPVPYRMDTSFSRPMTMMDRILSQPTNHEIERH